MQRLCKQSSIGGARSGPRGSGTCGGAGGGGDGGTEGVVGGHEEAGRSLRVRAVSCPEEESSCLTLLPQCVHSKMYLKTANVFSAIAVIMVQHGVAWHGVAWRGVAWRGVA